MSEDDEEDDESDGSSTAEPAKKRSKDEDGNGKKGKKTHIKQNLDDFSEEEEEILDEMEALGDGDTPGLSFIVSFGRTLTVKSDGGEKKRKKRKRADDYLESPALGDEDQSKRPKSTQHNYFGVW